MTYPLTETQYRDTLTAHMPPGHECKQSTWSQLMCRGASTLHKPSTALFFPLVLVLTYKRELFSITACSQALCLMPSTKRGVKCQACSASLSVCMSYWNSMLIAHSWLFCTSFFYPSTSIFRSLPAVFLHWSFTVSFPLPLSFFVGSHR